MEHKSKFVAYFRVSTDQQGKSGLGLAAQRKVVIDYLNGGKWELVAEFTEVESGKRTDRPQLEKALAVCRLKGATLLVAKLDRLARNAHFLLGLEKAGVEFLCCDMPSANRLTVGIMAMVAEEEARMISARTKAALAAAKERGVKLGSPQNLAKQAAQKGRRLGTAARMARARNRANDLLPIIEEEKSVGVTTLKGIADALNRRGIPTARGGIWRPTQVRRVLEHRSADLH